MILEAFSNLKESMILISQSRGRISFGFWSCEHAAGFGNSVSSSEGVGCPWADEASS